MSESSSHVPRILHQSWRGQSLPKLLGGLSSRWRAVMPNGWEYHLWTDQDNRNLWERYYPHMLPLYDRYRHAIERADVTRLLYLDIYGGVYVDLSAKAWN